MPSEAIVYWLQVTGLGRELGISTRLARAPNWLRIGDPHRGAYIIVRLATDSDILPALGSYFSVKDARPIRQTPSADNDATRQDLLGGDINPTR
jgi:hypothetical protein